MPTSPHAANEGLNRRYLRPHDLRRLKPLLFASRRIIEGLYSGQHPTPQRGQSVEFRDYRPYLPGDEINSVDWKVYGRTDKLFVRIFEHHADMTVNVLVDASASMGYRGDLGGDRRFPLVLEPPADETRVAARPRVQQLSKYDQACCLAAAIGFLIVNQQDRVGFGVAQEGLIHHRPPSSSLPHLLGILDCMERTIPRGCARLTDTLNQLATTYGRRDILVVCSDLWDNRDEILKALSLIGHRGGEVILFHTLHPHELELPQIENGLFVDSESSARIRLNVHDIRDTHAEQMRLHLDAWRAACRGAEFDYNLVTTEMHYSQALENYMHSRSAMK